MPLPSVTSHLHNSPNTVSLRIVLILKLDVSQIQQRRKIAKCVDAEARIQNLNPGRDCEDHGQCRSRLCLNNICQGKLANETCATHADCANGIFCSGALQNNNWPYISRCTPYLKNSQCEEDY